MKFDTGSNIDKFDLSSFLNYSLAMESVFKDSRKHTYFDLFNGQNFDPNSTLANYPGSMANIGADIITKNENESASTSSKPRFSFGTNVQWIGETKVFSTYSIVQGDLVLNTGSAVTESTLPQAFIVDSRFKVYYRKMHFGVSVYNVANNSYYLPSVNFRSRRQNAEGRMILLNFTYLINVN